MSFTNNDQVFHRISEQELSEIIAYNLRKDHGYHGSSVKNIARMIGLNPRIVRNWYEGRNIPSLSNFLRLISCSPSLMKSFLELAESTQNGRSSTAVKTDALSQANNNYGDISVTINVELNRKTLLKLNQRQLWFYGFLQKGMSVNAEDIANVWDVNIRTAKRDIAGLVALNLIEFVGAPKTGRYMLVENHH